MCNGSQKYGMKKEVSYVTTILFFLSLFYLQRLRDAGGVVDPERGVQFPDIREMRVAGSKDVVALNIVISFLSVFIISFHSYDN